MPERDGEADAGRYLIEAKDAAAAVDDLMRGALPMPVARVGIVGGEGSPPHSSPPAFKLSFMTWASKRSIAH